MIKRIPIKKRTLGALVILMALGGVFSCLSGEENTQWPTVWDGVYTTSQAARGEAAYRASCASCHGLKLEGKGDTPPLIGRDFTWDWDFTGVDNLFEEILFAMPIDRESQLSARRKADILAYILKSNGFPAGKKELSADPEDLRVVLFEMDRVSK